MKILDELFARTHRIHEQSEEREDYETLIYATIGLSTLRIREKGIVIAVLIPLTKVTERYEIYFVIWNPKRCPALQRKDGHEPEDSDVITL